MSAYFVNSVEGKMMLECRLDASLKFFHLFRKENAGKNAEFRIDPTQEV